MMVPVTIIVILVVSLNLSASQTTENTKPVSLGDAFLVQLEGCTGTIISKDWVLSAAHCFDDASINRPSKVNEFGDMDISLESNKIYLHRVNKDKTVSLIKPWTTPLQPSKVLSKDVYWRAADRLILHKSFEGEALSWKGFDFALLHMTEEYGRLSANYPTTIPICLADAGFPDATKDPVFMAGFGRRQIPHCFTNEIGPEAFEACARPVPCTKDHRTRHCGIEFTYNDREYKSCINEEKTPSAKDPVCINLRATQPGLFGSPSLIHVFEGSQFKTTCYPENPPQGSNGWCVTRRPGIDVTQAPTFTSGWGFCSNATNQITCQKGVTESTDSDDIQVSLLEDKYCVDKLEANLIVEQPEAERSSYDPLLTKSKILCIGQKYKKDLMKDLYYKMSGEWHFEKIQPTHGLMTQVIQTGRVDPNPIDGGPSCFGDSGGPLWKTMTDANGNKVPVQIGVFSFMLWGTCIGRSEPGYYGRVADFNNWILQYVPKQDVCTYSNSSNPRNIV